MIAKHKQHIVWLHTSRCWLKHTKHVSKTMCRFVNILIWWEHIRHFSNTSAQHLANKLPTVHICFTQQHRWEASTFSTMLGICAHTCTFCDHNFLLKRTHCVISRLYVLTKNVAGRRCRFSRTYTQAWAKLTKQHEICNNTHVYTKKHTTHQTHNNPKQTNNNTQHTYATTTNQSTHASYMYIYA